MNARHDMVTVFVVRSMPKGVHEFLQLRRTEGDYLGGTWQLIRGGVESGESYPAAALRELLEESGLQPRQLYRLAAVESFYTAIDDTLWHSVAFCAVVDACAGVTLNAEHDKARWIEHGQLESQLMWASEKTLLRDCLPDILDDRPAKPWLKIEIA